MPCPSPSQRPPCIRGHSWDNGHVAKHGVTTFLQTFEDDVSIMFDVVPDLLVVLDNQGTIKRVNKAFEQATGRNRYEVYGQGLSQFVLIDDLARFLRSFTAAEKDKQSFRLLHRDSGVVTCALIKWRNQRGRSYIVMRRMTK